MPVPEGWGTETRAERQTPKPGRTVVLPLQFAATHRPARRTCVLSEHARQEDGPAAEQLEHVESHDWHVEDVGSRNCALAQVGRQRPLARTGRAGGQAVHWLKAPPEHDAQSGWHARRA